MAPSPSFGRPQVVDVVAAPGARAGDVLRWAAAVDQMSSHVLLLHFDQEEAYFSLASL